MTKEVKEYIKTLQPNKDLDLYIKFSYKRDYIEQIMSIMYKDVQQKIDYGYGNYNASICFLFENRDLENKLKFDLQEILEKYGIDYYSIYNTYFNKIKSFYSKNIELLSNELLCVKPNIIFYFGNNKYIKELIEYKTIDDLKNSIYVIDNSERDFIRLIKNKDILRR